MIHIVASPDELVGGSGIARHTSGSLPPIADEPKRQEGSVEWILTRPSRACGPCGVLFGGQLGGQFQKSHETLGPQGGRSERVGFEPTVRLPIQRFSSSKISHGGAGRIVPNHPLLFAIFPLMILVCDAQYHPVSHSWFAIWFANSLHQRRLMRLGLRAGLGVLANWTHTPFRRLCLLYNG